MKLDYEVSEISLEDATSIIQKEHYLKEIYGLDYPWPSGLFQSQTGIFHGTEWYFPWPKAARQEVQSQIDTKTWLKPKKVFRNWWFWFHIRHSKSYKTT